MVRELSPREFATSFAGSPRTVLLDVREVWEFALASIPGAVHIPMSQVPDRLQELDAERDIVVMCHGGVRSLRVAHFLAAHGYRSVANLSGGIDAWSRDVDPAVPTY
jgi:rhodanese-related sulfurtransferase